MHVLPGRGVGQPYVIVRMKADPRGDESDTSCSLTRPKSHLSTRLRDRNDTTENVMFLFLVDLGLTFCSGKPAARAGGQVLYTSLAIVLMIPFDMFS